MLILGSLLWNILKVESTGLLCGAAEEDVRRFDVTSDSAMTTVAGIRLEQAFRCQEWDCL